MDDGSLKLHIILDFWFFFRRGGLQRLLPGLHVHLPGFRRRDSWPRLDGGSQERGRSVRKERGRLRTSRTNFLLDPYNFLCVFPPSALPRELEEPQYGDCDPIELWEARPARRLSRHAGPRNRAQLWLAGT